MFGYRCAGCFDTSQHETSQLQRDGSICKDPERCQDFVFASLSFAVLGRWETGLLGVSGVI
jgi:hypothetical protein